MLEQSLFKQINTKKIDQLIINNPLATIITMGSKGITADHIPLYRVKLNEKRSVLRGHIAKANPLWKEISDRSDVLCIFQGAESYISPNYYPSKQLDEKAVPTWNYTTVHIKGSIEFIHDAPWKLAMLNTLTDTNEKQQATPWSVFDAPEDYIEKQLDGIVGLEITVQSTVAKWKVSQNKSEQDKQGVITGLASRGDDAMADLVKNNK